MRIEYHVINTGQPNEHWEIHYGDKRSGGDGWDKDHAVERAVEMARSNPPSTVVVHAVGGAVERTMPYDEAGKSRID
jgi:hypothetical protein